MELDIRNPQDAINRQKHDQLAAAMTQLTTVHVHVADLVCLEAPARLRRFGRWTSRDAVPLQATMQGGAAEVRDRVAQATQDFVERYQRSAAKFDHDRLLGRCQDRAPGRLGAHRCIGCLRSPAPFGDRLRVQSVGGSKGAATLFRRLELGSNTRRRAGAAVKNAGHRPSSS